MIVLYFVNAESAIEKLIKIKDNLMETKANYEKIMNSMKNNVEVENRLMKMGLTPTHRVVNIQSVSFKATIHMMPNYSWLFNKLNETLSNINYTINELDKVINYLKTNNIKGASVALFIDEINKHTKLVIMP